MPESYPESREDGQRGAYITALDRALALMSTEQLSALQEEAATLQSSLEVLRSAGDMPLLAGLDDGYTSIRFKIRQALEVSVGDEAAAQKLRLVCIECGMPADSSTPGEPCISCGSLLIDLDRTEPPED